MPNWVARPKVKTRMLEQRAGLRKSSGTGALKSGGASYDATTRLKAVLVRRDLLLHLTKKHSHFAKEIDGYASDKFYEQAFNLRPDGSKTSPSDRGRTLNPTLTSKPKSWSLHLSPYLNSKLTML